MSAAAILVEAFERIRGQVHRAVDGLDREALAYRPEPGANSIAWLVWHLTRVQDDHVATIAGREQVWVTSGWAAALGMDADPNRLGQGDGPAEVAALRPDGPSALLGYHAEVTDRSVAYLAGVDANELGRIIDRTYTPPVSVGVRLVSVLNDNLQHVGQARYLRGIIDRLR
jgi:hypothetical protein